jgi:hypothetical protein
MAKPALAQFPTPSVPEFTVQPVGPSYTVPTTYSLNQSSGQIVAQIGYNAKYSYVEITIKNQPFTPYSNASIGQNILLYYNVQIKDDDQGWVDLYNPEDGYPTQSDSAYTNISIPVYGVQNVGIMIPVGTQTDIQVEAMIGYVSRVLNPNANGNQLDMFPWEFTGQTSGWSKTQTVTLPADIPLSPTATPSSSTSTLTPTPTLTSVGSAPNSYLLLITTIALVVIVSLLVVIISLLLYLKKMKKSLIER